MHPEPASDPAHRVRRGSWAGVPAPPHGACLHRMCAQAAWDTAPQQQVLTFLRAQAYPHAASSCTLRRASLTNSADVRRHTRTNLNTTPHHLALQVHRDLKPGNILIDARGRAAISDFGLARIKTTGASALSTSNVNVGTVSYMAPECFSVFGEMPSGGAAAGGADGRRAALPLTEKVDVYALGKERHANGGWLPLHFW